MSNEVTRSDGFDETDNNDQRVIQGTLLKCIDGVWKTRDGVSIPPGTQMLVLATTSVVQCWSEQKPVDTIFKEPGKDLPNVDELNAQIPQDEWEMGIDGKPRPPWQHQEIVYMLDPKTAEKFTFASGTGGAHVAVRELRERVQMMRAIRGEDVIPLVEFASTPFGRFNKLRPVFKIVDWAEWGVRLTRDVTPQIADQSKPQAEADATAPQSEARHDGRNPR